jgi:glucose-1-phosphate cytidylyltransferase
MKVVILAGGFGTRISEETHLKPKPMVEIGNRPIIWHIMKIFSYYGFNEFIICLGYKGNVIKDYFSNYYLYNSDVTFHLNNDNEKIIHKKFVEPWSVTLVETGMDTMTGGRIKKIHPYIDDKPFLLTYGDGVGNIDINKLVDFHKNHGKIATVTATQPKGRFGTLNLGKNQIVDRFEEKVQGDDDWINAGFFVFQPEIFKYISGNSTVLEKEPLENLSINKELFAYKHRGFWHPMDTLRDRVYLEELWNTGKAPWNIWS